MINTGAGTTYTLAHIHQWIEEECVSLYDAMLTYLDDA